MIDSPIAVPTDALGNTQTSVADGSARRFQVDAKFFKPSGANSINKAMATSTAATSMLVAGTAATPVTFSVAPASGQTITIAQVNLVLVAGTIAFTGAKFMNGTALTNGIAIGGTVSSATTTYATLKINEDFLLYNNTGIGYSAGSAGGLLSGGTNSILVFNFILSQPLVYASGDSLFVKIQDNLTLAGTGGNLVYMQGSAQGFINA